MRQYKAFYNQKTYDLEAEGLYEAKLKAIQHFKPARSKEHMVSVVLADVPVSTQFLGV